MIRTRGAYTLSSLRSKTFFGGSHARGAHGVGVSNDGLAVYVGSFLRVESGDGYPSVCVSCIRMVRQRFWSAGLQTGGACLSGVGSPGGRRVHCQLEVGVEVWWPELHPGMA
eukprot:1332564-Alexandrium_andersonii.AAC.1